MNAAQADNLRILIRHMESLKRPVLNMNDYFESCGTPACALGEACTIPALAERGLGQVGTLRVIVAGHANVFGLLGFATTRLFGSEDNNAWRRKNVTPQEWAAEARKVLAGNGYSMDSPDLFAAFMAKVREPVAVEALAPL